MFKETSKYSKTQRRKWEKKLKFHTRVLFMGSLFCTICTSRSRRNKNLKKPQQTQNKQKTSNHPNKQINKTTKKQPQQNKSKTQNQQNTIHQTLNHTGDLSVYFLWSPLIFRTYSHYFNILGEGDLELQNILTWKASVIITEFNSLLLTGLPKTKSHNWRRSFKYSLNSYIISTNTL